MCLDTLNEPKETSMGDDGGGGGSDPNGQVPDDQVPDMGDGQGDGMGSSSLTDGRSRSRNGGKLSLMTDYKDSIEVGNFNCNQEK